MLTGFWQGTALQCAGKRQRQRPEHGSDFREMGMNKKFMFVALGYLLLLAALEFALDASIVAMIVDS
jgi:hypothetical protein